MTKRRKKTGRKKGTLSCRAAAALTVFALCNGHEGAYAAGADQVANNIGNSAGSVPTLISATCYICGAGLAVLGIFALKHHVDDPANMPMRRGLMRLASGGALLSMPFTLSVMQGSVSGAGVKTQPIQAGFQPFNTAGGAIYHGS